LPPCKDELDPHTVNGNEMESFSTKDKAYTVTIIRNQLNLDGGPIEFESEFTII
jgi:hypothetical protein